MISKELLSLVLNKHIAEKDVIKIVENDLYIFYDESIKIERVNLDTLCRLCKEWCYEQGNGSLFISSGMDEWYYCHLSIGLSIRSDFSEYNKTFHSKYKGSSELEAIIKATNWVAKEKGLL